MMIDFLSFPNYFFGGRKFNFSPHKSSVFEWGGCAWEGGGRGGGATITTISKSDQFLTRVTDMCLVTSLDRGVVTADSIQAEASSSHCASQFETHRDKIKVQTPISTDLLHLKAAKLGCDL